MGMLLRRVRKAKPEPVVVDEVRPKKKAPAKKAKKAVDNGND